MNKSVFSILAIITVLMILLIAQYFKLEIESSSKSRSACQFSMIARFVSDNHSDLLVGSNINDWYIDIDMSHMENRCGEGLTLESTMLLDSSGAKISLKKVNEVDLMITREKGPAQEFFSLQTNKVRIGPGENGDVVILLRE